MTDISEDSNTPAKDVSLLKFWEQEVLPRLTADLVYDHPSHAFQRSNQKWRGGSPFRKSKSGTSFAVWPIISASTMRDASLQATPLLTSTA